MSVVSINGICLANFIAYVSSEYKTVYAWLNIWFGTVVSINRICLAKFLVDVSSEYKTYIPD
jgi:hypothetical protein